MRDRGFWCLRQERNTEKQSRPKNKDILLNLYRIENFQHKQ